jgi:branched-chain amino acid transport system substrate-binding protein
MFKTMNNIFFLAIITLLPLQAKTENSNGSLPNNIKIGALLCLTTSCADYGKNSLDGVLLAVEQEKERGGLNVEVVVEDSSDSNTKTTVSAYQSIVRKLDNDLIIGPSWTVGGLSISPLISKDHNVLVISPSVGVREFNESGENIFNVWPHDDVSTSALAERSYAQGIRNIAIVVTMEPWEQTQAKTFKTKFESLGGTITSYIEYLSTETDLRTFALKTLKSKPEAVLFANYNHIGLYAKELTKLGYKGKKLSILLDKIQIDQSQGSLEGVEFTINPEADKIFKDAFTKKFSREPGISADMAYDAMNLFIKSIKETKSLEPKILAKHLLTIKDYKGASGIIKFDDKGGIIRPTSIMKLVGDKYVLVSN